MNYTKLKKEKFLGKKILKLLISLLYRYFNPRTTGKSPGKCSFFAAEILKPRGFKNITPSGAQHLLKKVLGAIFLCLFLISFWLIYEKVEKVRAGEQDLVYGWAWSENFGWFSANCANLGKCPDDPPPPFDYGLDIDESGNVTGYLWAEHIGWIKFGGTGAPGGEEAFYDRNTGKISGWAKILALGDDGWLKLRGPAVSPGSGPFYKCADCKDIQDEEGNLIDVVCKICFKSELYGGSDSICSNCAGCNRGTETCTTCSGCDAYGVAIDSSNGKVLGWAWNGNTDPALGVGWLNFSPVKGGLVLQAPWLETKYSGIYTKGSLRTPSAFVPILNKYNATYCLAPTGEILNFTSEEGCYLPGFESPQGLNYPKTINRYTNVLGKIDLEGILAGQYGQVKLIESSEGIENMLAGKVYYRNGDLTISTKTFINGVGKQNGAGLVLVKGNLYITGNIQYQGGSVSNLKNLASVGWMVLDDGSGTKGNIYIDPGVSDLVGVFYAEGTIFTGTTGKKSSGLPPTPPDGDWPLTVKGLMLARMFKFERLWQGAERGTEQVIYDGRVLANTPPGMEDIAKAMPIWRETAP